MHECAWLVSRVLLFATPQTVAHHGIFPLRKHSVSSVAQSCPTLCDPIDCNMPGLPVPHQLPEFTQTHVHWIGDAIQSSHPLSSPSPPALNLSQHQGLFKWVSSSHQVAKVLEFQLQHQLVANLNSSHCSFSFVHFSFFFFTCFHAELNITFDCRYFHIKLQWNRCSCWSHSTILQKHSSNTLHVFLLLFFKIFSSFTEI